MATSSISTVPLSKTLNGGMTDNRVALQYVDSMSENSVLKVSEVLLSNNGLYELEFLRNGNLVLYRTSDRFALWSSNTAGSGAVQAMMKSGNLVLYTAGTIAGGRSLTAPAVKAPAANTRSVAQPVSFNPLASHSNGNKQQLATEVFQNDTAGDYELVARQVWSSKTSGHPFSILQIRNDGNLVISNSKKIVWDSNTQRYLTAKKKITEKYEQVGHRFSPIGLPLTGVENQGDHFVQHFRSGHITSGGLITDFAQVIQTNSVEITWNAIECHQKQEKFDDIIGSIGVIAPASAKGESYGFPQDREEYTMGPGLRIIETNVPIYNGPIGDIYIMVSLMEHDSGNIDEYKKKIAGLITKAATSYLDGDGGLSESNASDMGLIGDLSLGVVNIVADFLGAGDDPFNPGTAIIDKDDILNKFKTEPGKPDQFPLFQLDREGKKFKYTHPITVEGIDGGGDLGQYTLYFTVELRSRSEFVN